MAISATAISVGHCVPSLKARSNPPIQAAPGATPQIVGNSYTDATTAPLTSMTAVVRYLYYLSAIMFMTDSITSMAVYSSGLWLLALELSLPFGSTRTAVSSLLA